MLSPSTHYLSHKTELVYSYLYCAFILFYFCFYYSDRSWHSCHLLVLLYFSLEYWPICVVMFHRYLNNLKLLFSHVCLCIALYCGKIEAFSLSRTDIFFFIYRLPFQETAFFIHRLPFQETACCFLGQFYRLQHLALIRTQVFFFY